jgi:hypothetical protein
MQSPVDTAASAIQVKPSQLADLLAFLAKHRRPAFILGRPGCGKSQIGVRSVTKTGLFESVPTFIAATKDPSIVEGFGVPNTAQGYMEFLRLKLFSGTAPIALFLDEINLANDAMFAACLDLALNPDRYLPAGSYVFAAGNRPGAKDRAKARELPAPFKRRFTTVELIPDLGDWTRNELRVAREEPAMAMDARVIAYAQRNPDCITDEQDMSGPAYATPAGMSEIGRLIRAGIPDAVRDQALCGTIGVDHGSKLAAFLDACDVAPLVRAILSDPFTAPIPADFDTLFNVLFGLEQSASDATFPAIVTFAKRLGDSGKEEYGAALVANCCSKDATLKLTSAYVEYATNGKLQLVA